jgi:hypothetical protein
MPGDGPRGTREAMLHALLRGARPHRFQLSAGVVSALGFLLLGPLAAVITLGLVPRAFEIESQCVGAFGSVPSGGDTYVGAVVAVGTLGWLAAFLGVLFAGVAEQPRVLVLLPLVWFGVLVAAALVAAAFVGPALCPV